MKTPRCIVCNDKICKCLKKKVDDSVKADCPSYKSNNLIFLSNSLGCALRVRFPEDGKEVNIVIKELNVHHNEMNKKLVAKILPNTDEMVAYKFFKLLAHGEREYYVRSTIENFTAINRFKQILQKNYDLFKISDIKTIKVYTSYVFCKHCAKCKKCGAIFKKKTKCPECGSSIIQEYRRDRTHTKCPECDNKLIRSRKVNNYEFKIIVLARQKAKYVLEEGYQEDG